MKRNVTAFIGKDYGIGEWTTSDVMRVAGKTLFAGDRRR